MKETISGIGVILVSMEASSEVTVLGAESSFAPTLSGASSGLLCLVFWELVWAAEGSSSRYTLVLAMGRMVMILYLV